MMHKRNMIFSLSILGVFLLFHPLTSSAQGKRDLLLVSGIFDASVLTIDGEETGEVDDLVMRRSGKVKKITVELGGFFGLGEKLVGIRSKKVRVKNGTAVVDLTREQLENKVEFDYKRRGLRPDYFYKSWPNYYSPPPYKGSYYGRRRETKEGEEWAHSPGRFLASIVLDRRLINHRGIRIGEIRDLLIDKEEFEVKKIILSADEFRGEGSHVALPYEPLGFGAYGLVYDISVEELKDLPEYPY